MICLSLDTTTRDGSVALIVDDRVIDERRGDVSRSHAERLPAELTDVATAHGIAIADVDLFAVAAGPGSFTGLRIGIATVQGLAFVERRSVVALSALDALAHLAAIDLDPGALVSSWIDAQRGDVYAALYRVADAPPFAPERLTTISEPVVGDPAEIASTWIQRCTTPAVCVGNGAIRYESVVGECLKATRVGGAPLLAGAIGRLAIVRAERGEAVHPAAIQPLYVRRPDAEIDRDRRRLTTTDTKDTTKTC
jgi:tRNA threonylcarbamoyladenosine biosynthesis protein TsaB